MLGLPEARWKEKEEEEEGTTWEMISVVINENLTHLDHVSQLQQEVVRNPRFEANFCPSVIADDMKSTNAFALV